MGDGVNSSVDLPDCPSDSRKARARAEQTLAAHVRLTPLACESLLAFTVARNQPSSLQNLLRRPLRDWLWVIEATATVLSARWLILTTPFKRIGPQLGHSQAETLPTVPAEQQVIARRISWSVQAASRHAPVDLVCLPQAIAAQRMLVRRGVPSTLYLGVKLPEAASLTAHAWLRAGDRMVTGDQARPGHTTLASFAHEAHKAPLLTTSRSWLAAFTLSIAAGFSFWPEPFLHGWDWDRWPSWLRVFAHWIGAHDFAFNFGGFALVNLILHFLWFGPHRDPLRYRIISGGMVAGIMILLEAGQFFIPHRNPDLGDMIAATAAAAVTTLPWVKFKGKA